MQLSSSNFESASDNYIPGNIEQRKRDFHSSLQTDSTKTLTKGQKRSLRRKRKLRVDRDAKCKAVIAFEEEKDALKAQLASQEEDFASVAQRYKSDRDSLVEQNSTLLAEIEVLKSAEIPAASSDELTKTQLELQNAKRQIEKLKHLKRDLATDGIARFFDSHSLPKFVKK